MKKTIVFRLSIKLIERELGNDEDRWNLSFN